METVAKLKARHERELKEAQFAEAVSDKCLDAGLPLPQFVIHNPLYVSEGVVCFNVEGVKCIETIAAAFESLPLVAFKMQGYAASIGLRSWYEAQSEEWRAEKRIESDAPKAPLKVQADQHDVRVKFMALICGQPLWVEIKSKAMLQHFMATGNRVNFPGGYRYERRALRVSPQWQSISYPGGYAEAVVQRLWSTPESLGSYVCSWDYAHREPTHMDILRAGLFPEREDA